MGAGRNWERSENCSSRQEGGADQDMPVTLKQSVVFSPSSLGKLFFVEAQSNTIEHGDLPHGCIQLCSDEICNLFVKAC